MSYNDEYFEADRNEALKKRLSNLHLWQSRLIGYLAEYLIASNDQRQMPGCAVFLKLLLKISFNLDTAPRLLPMLNDDCRYKASVNLLYRAIIDDKPTLP